MQELYKETLEQSPELKEVGILGLSYIYLKNIEPKKLHTATDCLITAVKIRDFLQRHKRDSVEHLLKLARYRGKY